MNKVLRLGSVLAIFAVVAACGGPGPTGGPGATRGPGATGGGNGVPTTDPGASSGSAPRTGATVRLVNAWAETDALGPNVKLRVAGADTEVVVLSANPGQVTDFAELPPAEFGDGLAALEAIAEGAEDGIRLDGFAAGDRVTVIVHGEAAIGGDDILMRVERMWEHGEQAVGVPWPTPGNDVGVIAVLAGPLLALDTNVFVHLRTDTGDCLTDATFDRPQEGGFGGTSANYFLLPENVPTTIHVGSAGASDCVPIEPDLGIAEVDTSTGKRFALVVWGMADDLEVMTLDMGTP